MSTALTDIITSKGTHGQTVADKETMQKIFAQKTSKRLLIRKSYGVMIERYIFNPVKRSDESHNMKELYTIIVNKNIESYGLMSWVN